MLKLFEDSKHFDASQQDCCNICLFGYEKKKTTANHLSGM